MNDNKYLTDIPQFISEYGFCKTLTVRREVIHLKHIFTEIFIRKSIDINLYLNKLDINLFDYMSLMSQRLRSIHHFSRAYDNDLNLIVKHERDNFFPTLELYKGLNNIIVLDFDGVVTENNFHKLYELCVNRCETVICSANPTVTNAYFIRNLLPRPNRILANKGKIKKIKALIELQKRYDYVFYIDNEIEYLEYAWLFGLQTYHWSNNKIKYFTMKTK
jgi:hypothetical protein